MKQNIHESLRSIINNPDLDEFEVEQRLRLLLIEKEKQAAYEKPSLKLNDLVQTSQLTWQGDHSMLERAIFTGFKDFDKQLGGLTLGEYVIIGGRPSMGKTQLLLNFVFNISLTTPVLYFTFDLSASLLTYRFLSCASGIPIHGFLHNSLSQDDKEKLDIWVKKMPDYKLFINDSCSLSLSALRAHCQKHVEEDGVKVVCVDYLQMMGNTRYKNQRESEISYISRELKNIARDFNICLIAISQLSRAVEYRIGSKHPVLSDLRDSGSIEQDADKVLFLYRPEYYNILIDEEGIQTDRLTEIIVAKNRNGTVGTIRVMRSENFTHFTDIPDIPDIMKIIESRLDELDTPF